MLLLLVIGIFLHVVNASFGESFIVQSVAGNGNTTVDFNAKDQNASNASIFPIDIAFDRAGEYYFIADFVYNCVRKVSISTGVLSTVAGRGVNSFSGDGGQARLASLSEPYGVAVGPGNDLYIADTFNGRIRKVDSNTGVIVTVAGSGSSLYLRDGVKATDAGLNMPVDILFDSKDEILYISDYGNSCVRKVILSTGLMYTVAGVNLQSGYNGDGILGTTAYLKYPFSLALDATNTNLFIADSGNQRIRSVSLVTGNISTVAGTGYAVGGAGGYNGDDISALDAQLNLPTGLVVDVAGNIFISDTGNNRIRVVAAVDSQIYTVAGTGVPIFNGDGLDSKLTTVHVPRGLAIYPKDGAIYFADQDNDRVRVLVPTN